MKDCIDVPIQRLENNIRKSKESLIITAVIEMITEKQSLPQKKNREQKWEKTIKCIVQVTNWWGCSRKDLAVYKKEKPP